MNFCPECGTKSDPNSQFCGNCGSSIQTESSKPVEKAQPTGYQQPSTKPSGYQQPPQQGYQQPPQQGYQQTGYQSMPGATYQGAQLDEFPVWYYICAFFIPLVALTIWATNKDTRPTASKNIIIVTAIGFVLNMIIATAIRFARF